MVDFQFKFSFHRFLLVLLVVVLMSFALNLVGVSLDAAPFNFCVFVLVSVVAVIGYFVGRDSR